MNILNIAKKVFEIESKEILNLSKLLTNDFEKIIYAIFNAKGKLIISGMGKSGIIGKKIAATLASTGTSSFFLHPGEAYHGDLGMIGEEDIVLLISNSGETDEILKLIPFLKNQGNIMISMSSNPKSTLALNTNFHLNIFIEEEVCPLHLAPMTSTTATLVMGDALAVSLMKLRNFKETDFAKYHPGGTLGKRLLTTVETVMIKNNLPICDKELSIKDVIHKMTYGKCGLVIITENNKVLGIITDGDIRRYMETHEENFFALIAKDIMTKNPKTINANSKLVEACEIMNKNKITALIVEDDLNELVGVVNSHDLEI